MADQDIVRFEGTGKMVRDEDGYFVKYSDYAEARATIDRITAERDGLRARVEMEGSESVRNLKRAHAAEAERDGLRKALEALNEVAPAVENLACHQEQCDMDGVMVKVSRQALDEVVNAINTAACMATLRATDAESKGGV